MTRSTVRQCPVCKDVIEKSYCPGCGLHYTGRRVSFSTAIGDLINSFYSVDRSVFINFRDMIVRPGQFINLYLEGYRNYYFSPMRFLILAAAMLAFAFLIGKNHFLYMRIDLDGAASQIVFLVLFLPLFTLANWITYRHFKKNIFEHFVIVTYNLSFWVIIFSLISMALSFTDWDNIKLTAVIIFLGLILVWNSRPLKMGWLWRFLYPILNFLVFLAVIRLLIFVLAKFTDLKIEI